MRPPPSALTVSIAVFLLFFFFSSISDPRTGAHCAARYKFVVYRYCAYNIYIYNNIMRARRAHARASCRWLGNRCQNSNDYNKNSQKPIRCSRPVSIRIMTVHRTLYVILL